MTFVKGQSGNPAGRPRGCKNKLNRDFDEDLLKEGKYLREKLIRHFEEGNATALRLVTQRMAPVSKGRPIEIDLPPLKSPADRLAAVEVINQALCEGEITIDEASGLIKYVDQALGLDRPAVSKAQLVGLMKEIVRLQSMVAMMAHRLDAEFGVDNIKAESTAKGGPSPLGDAEEIAAIVDNINAESTIDAAAVAAPAPRDETPALVNNKESTSAGAEPFIHDPQAPYGTPPAAMTIGDDVLTLMREPEPPDAVAPHKADVPGSRLSAERSQSQAA